MVTELYAPKWFYGVDCVFDIVSIIAGLLVAFYSYKVYKLTSQKKYKYFSLSFFLIALAFMMKVLMNTAIYSKVFNKVVVGFLTITVQTSQRIGWINHFASIFYMFLMLLAFAILLIMAFRIRDEKLIFLFVYFAFITALLSKLSYFIFHITLALFLSYLFIYYYKNFLRIRSKSSMTVAYSFFLIFLSQVVFIFMLFSKGVYVLGETLQLLGYLLLLLTFILVLKK